MLAAPDPEMLEYLDNRPGARHVRWSSGVIAEVKDDRDEDLRRGWHWFPDTGLFPWRRNADGMGCDWLPYQDWTP